MAPDAGVAEVWLRLRHLRAESVGMPLEVRPGLSRRLERHQVEDLIGNLQAALAMLNTPKEPDRGGSALN
ncbi:MAG: hypothetical protein HS128_19275 [Ideonella sp.]|nr:hypothetical protein [Ideonella sp.]MCC7455967.1 hypothetical protein [Nitrospira sp.]